jgi:hypothetical protein
MKRLLASTALILPLLISSAYANPIMLGGTASSVCDLIADGPTKSIFAKCQAFSVTAKFGTDTGTANFAADNITTSPEVSGVFPVISQTGHAFDITFTDGDALNGNLVLTNLSDGPNDIQLVGTFDYTLVEGDTAFTSTFGNNGSIDLFSNPSMPLEDLRQTRGPLILSHGLIVDVFEPNTLILLSIGLILFGLGLGLKRIYPNC